MDDFDNPLGWIKTETVEYWMEKNNKEYPALLKEWWSEEHIPNWSELEQLSKDLECPNPAYLFTITLPPEGKEFKRKPDLEYAVDILTSSIDRWDSKTKDYVNQSIHEMFCELIVW